MYTPARIGSTIVIVGEITAEEPLTVSGRVYGTVRIQGHRLTIDPGARVEADIVAQAVVIHGEAQGTVTASERIVLTEGAAAEGTLTAPGIAIADGATFHGTVDAQGRAAASLRLVG
jgi:cytoskeletal protein CcmA (bactofilin family)